MKLVVGSRLYLVFSGLLVLLVCMLLGCEQQSKEYGTKSNEQEVKNEGLKVEGEKVAWGQVPAKEEEKPSSKKTVISKKADKIKVEKTEEEKGVEKEVLKWVRKIEQKCSGGDTNPIGWLIGGELDKLEKIGKPAIPTLIEVFCDKDRKWMLRYFIGNESLPGQLERLCEKGEKDDRVFEPVIKILEDRSEDEAVRMVATYILSAAMDKRAIEPLMRLYKTEENALVRINMVSALHMLGDKQTIELFVEIINTVDFQVYSPPQFQIYSPLFLD